VSLGNGEGEGRRGIEERKTGGEVGRVGEGSDPQGKILFRYVISQ